MEEASGKHFTFVSVCESTGSKEGRGVKSEEKWEKEIRDRKPVCFEASYWQKLENPKRQRM